MKHKSALSFVILLTSIAFFAAEIPMQALAGGHTTVSSRVLDINRLVLDIKDRGYLMNDGMAGGTWLHPPDRGDAIIYDQGPWIIGKVSSTPAAAMTLWRSSYSPGPLLDGRPGLDVRPADSVRFHPYKIATDSSPQDSDFAAWPQDLGAPVDPRGRPLLFGDELIWSVFNGADTSCFPSGWRWLPAQGRYEQFPRLPVEIHEAIYAHSGAGVSDTTLLANTVFIEWKFINKGTATIESCYVGLWADIDIDRVQYNAPAVDTTHQLAYCWQPDTVNKAPFAVGYCLLYGPAVPDPGGTAFVRGMPRSGFRNLPLSSFWGFDHDGRGDTNFAWAPNALAASWNVARGFDKSGRPIVDSLAHQATRFPFSGDPVTGSGWIYHGIGNGSAGVLMFSGPFTLAPGDSQWVMYALIPADAGDRFASITLLRDHAARLRSMSYQEIAHPQPLAVDMSQPTLPGEVTLFQNYPNPFNPTTVVSYQLPAASMVKLAVYDLLGREVAMLVNERRNAGVHEVKFDGSRLASGLYFYRLQAGRYVQTRKLLLMK